MPSSSFLFVVYLGLAGSLLLAQQQDNQERGVSSGSGAGSVQHIVFGDLSIDETEAPPGVPNSFTVSLNSLTGLPLGRDSIPPNGRFRFQNIPNGEYTLVIEADSEVLYSERFILNEKRSTDVRKNIELAWKGGSLNEGYGGGVLYARSRDNQRLFEKAQKAAEEGRLEDGISRLQELTEEDSDDFEAWSELGTFYFRMEKYKNAERAYERALEEKPDFLVAMSNLGKVRLARKDYQSAVNVLEKALQIDPQRAELNQLMGEAFLGMKKGSLAVGYLNKAIELDPVDMAEVHLRLAQLYDLAGYRNLAAQEYSRFLAKRPDDSRKSELQKYIQEHGK